MNRISNIKLSCIFTLILVVMIVGNMYTRYDADRKATDNVKVVNETIRENILFKSMPDSSDINISLIANRGYEYKLNHLMLATYMNYSESLISYIMYNSDGTKDKADFKATAAVNIRRLETYRFLVLTDKSSINNDVVKYIQQLADNSKQVYQAIIDDTVINSENTNGIDLNLDTSLIEKVGASKINQVLFYMSLIIITLTFRIMLDYRYSKYFKRHYKYKPNDKESIDE